MRNYSLNSEDSKNFILNYEIQNNKIIVNYAKGKPFEFPYSKSLEKNILSKMESQVTENAKFKQNHALVTTSGALFLLLCMIACSIVYLVSPIGGFDPAIITVLFLAGGGSVVKFTSDIVKYKKNLKDIEKNLYFLQEKKRLENANKIDNALKGTKLSTRLIKYENSKLDINNSRNIEIEELKKIVDNIKRNEALNYSSEKCNENTKIIKK